MDLEFDLLFLSMFGNFNFFINLFFLNFRVLLFWFIDGNCRLFKNIVELLKFGFLVLGVFFLEVFKYKY